MNALILFLAGAAGRAVRIIAGLLLIYLGLWIMGGTGGWLLAVVGVVPLLAGIFDFCLLAPLAGLPLNGKDIRRTH
jgi:hypothetical protein